MLRNQTNSNNNIYEQALFFPHEKIKNVKKEEEIKNDYSVQLMNIPSSTTNFRRSRQQIKMAKS
jgi:hypothetical protein